ncbi:hypothetical protein [Bergeyella cardium]|mgnify:CR=1|uniref:hypothetical protein n=1 Tax=Bergeyella cardium TaxID=1585976 RepID=UPI0013C47ACB|nr:hypothetical protein [Bergeyella cardium]WHE34040.1 hypothetical protein P8603_01950 [Bergeyella cardium]WHF60691.1 hypothetical protein O0R51_01945 [Bergeyella cardium]
MKQEKINNNGAGKWRNRFKKLGIAGLIFFTVKGIISTALIYFAGKGFWEIISAYFSK